MSNGTENTKIGKIQDGHYLVTKRYFANPRNTRQTPKSPLSNDDDSLSVNRKEISFVTACGSLVDH